MAGNYKKKKKSNLESPALFIIYRDVLDTKMCEELTDFEIGYLFFISIFYFCI